MEKLIQLLLILLVPYIAIRINRLPLFRKWLSPVVISYIVGIVFANFDIIPLGEQLSTTATEVTLMLALPMLLFTANVLTLLKNGKNSLFAFALAIVSAIIGVSMAGWYFQESLPDSWRLSGMLLGIYTGGIPNMQVIGKALNAPEETIILVNAADVFLGGIYLVLLSSVFYPFLKWFLPHEKKAEKSMEGVEKSDLSWSALGVGIPILLSMIVVAISVGLTQLIFGGLAGNDQWILLLLTTISLMVPFITKSKYLANSYVIGDYFLLAFCVALGMKADFDLLIAQGLDLAFFSGIALYGTIILHLLLAKLFKVDRDAFMISTTAAIFGPVFIGQITSVIGKKSLVLPGISLGLLGYAIGNYIGIALARFLHLWW